MELRTHFITVSLADLIDENEEISYAYNHSRTAKFKARKDELFKDSLVLVGATAIGIFDVRNTPKQVNLPGVEVHATILSQFLKGDFFKTNDMSHLYQVSGLTTW
jgi:CHASE2 domain-containing sensor protein